MFTSLYLVLLFSLLHNTLNIPASNEWQEIPKGVPIDPGQVIKMDFESGKNFIRPVDSSNSGVKNGESRLALDSKIEIKEKFYPHPFKNLSVEESPRRFRTIEELKKDLQPIMDLIKSDMEIIIELTLKLRNNSSTLEERVHCLNELSELLHDINNGEDAITIDLYTDILKMLASPSNDTCQPAASCIFAAAQNNRKVQIYLTERNATKVFYDIYTRQNNGDRFTTGCLSKSFSSVSAILRGCPLCMRDFFKKEYSHEFITQLLSFKSDPKIIQRTAQLLVSLYKSSQEPNDFYSLESFKTDCKKAKWCTTLKQNLPNTPISEDSYLQKSYEEFAADICGIKIHTKKVIS